MERWILISNLGLPGRAHSLQHSLGHALLSGHRRSVCLID